MIQLDTYSKEFEKEYWQAVEEKINISTQKEIVESCIKFLPQDFFTGNKDEFFKLLILAPFEKLKRAESYITKKKINIMKDECFKKGKKKRKPLNENYRTIHDSFTPLMKSRKQGTSMRVRIVKNTGLTVCPYCNRDYFNCRANDVSGAQIDHFFSKSDFPLFAVCLYNFVPVCGNCNRVKSAKSLAFASPFDNSINWEEDIIFTYDGSTIKDIKISIDAKGNLKNNIDSMRIEAAYQIHDVEVFELIEKEKMYSRLSK